MSASKSDAMEPEAIDLTPVRQALTRAEDEGDLPRARQLRRQLLRGRLAELSARVLETATARDFLLLDRIARDLQRNDDHELALELLAGARGLASRARDRPWERWFSTLGALSCIRLLDLEVAADVLAGVLGRPVEEELPEAAGWPRGVDGRAAAAHVLMLNVCGLLHSARGRSAAAEKLARAAFRLASERALPGISAADLALRHAETLLERGDFTAFEHLRAEHEPKARSSRARCHWTLLAVESLHLRGHLSDANARLEALLRGPQPAALLPELEEARSLRTNILALLNRFREARRELSAVEVGGEERDRLQQLIDARESFTAGLRLMPVPMDRRRRPEPAAEAGEPEVAAASSVERRYESVRAEWAWRANEVLLALHAGGQAGPRYDRLSAFAKGLDSPLLRAKHALLGALVCHSTGRHADAAGSARRVAAELEALDLPRDQLFAWQLVRWALLRGGAAAADPRLQAAQEQLDRALTAVRDRLHGADKVLLNFWSEVDLEISLRCHGIDDLAGPGWWRSWRRRARARSAIGLVLAKKRWPEAEAKEAGGAGGGATDVVIREVALGSRRGAGEKVHGLHHLPRAFLPRDAAVVVYVPLPDRVEVLLVTRSTCTRLVPQARAARGALWDLVRSAVEELHYRNPWAPDGDRTELEEVAACLGLEELADALPAHVTRLFIVPDDAIVHVPFAALPVRGLPLIHRWSPAFLPLAGWSSRGPAQAVKAAVGVAVERSRMVPLGELPYAVREVEAMRSLVPGTVALTGEHASREAVLRSLAGADVAHFACHGRFEPESPHRSALACEDGWLTIEDIRQVSGARLHLAVLGACWGARTFVLPGRQLINLPLAFLAGGADHVVASLWKIGDRSSADFAQELYSGSIADPAQALRRVQLAWCEKRAPGEWAPYVVYQRGLDAGRWGRGLLRLKRSLQARSFAS